MLLRAVVVDQIYFVEYLESESFGAAAVNALSFVVLVDFVVMSDFRFSDKFTTRYLLSV